MQLIFPILTVLFVLTSIVCPAQNKSRTDSLIKVLNRSGNISLKEKKPLLESIITELIDYDSANAEYYLQLWKKELYSQSAIYQVFYHKNRSTLYQNYSDSEKALREVNQGISIARRENLQIDLADLYNNRGNLKSEMEDDDGALEDFDQAISIYRSLAMKSEEALVLSNKANVYAFRGNFKTAVPYALEALKIREKTGDKTGVANTSFNLGIMFKSLDQLTDAQKYLNTAEEIYRELKDERSLATVYLVKGSIYRLQKNYERSKSSFLRALPIMEKYDFKPGLINAYENLGTIAARHEKNEEAALSYYLQAEKLTASLQRNQGKITSGINVAQSLLNLKRYDEFNTKIASIEKMARAYNYNQELLDILKLKMLYAFDRSQESGGREFLEEYEALADSIKSVEIQSDLNELKVKYETEKKEEKIKLLNSRNELQRQILAANELSLLNKELELEKKNLKIGNQELAIRNKDAMIANNELQIKNKEQEIRILELSDKNKSLTIKERNRQLLFGSGLVVLLAALGILYFNRRKIREKAKFQEVLIAEQDKAAKAVISAEENERSRMSQHLHDGLGQLLSAAKMNLQAAMEYLPEDDRMTKIYNNTLQLVDDSILEMRSVSHELVTNNVMRKGLANALKELIEKISNNRLKVNLEVNGLLENVSAEIQLIVYRILQESIQNVIKHAQASRIDILLNVDIEYLSGIVSDNGKGFDTSTTASRNGIGLENIATRIRFLKGSYKVSSAPGEGTKLQFEIPL
ncbi:MAG: tetratricopeptide repeat protein [Chitinophagaceae bacterium]|nr:tetratricopeptide repeat protein [Chitinophagaceae bacterium]